MSELTPPYAYQTQGSRLARAVLRLVGWRVSFDGLPTHQGVIIGYPHTSNWDFPVMMLVKWSIGLPVQFLAKDSLFRIPVFGPWLRWLGGLPIDRSSPQGVVGHLLGLFQQNQHSENYLWLGLSPEGTRSLTAGWRSGFYQLALQAKVPLCMVRIDYAQKHVNCANFMMLSGDEAMDYAHISKVYEGVVGFHAGQAAPVRPLKFTDTSLTRRSP